jgi:hypothetical protein
MKKRTPCEDRSAPAGSLYRAPAASSSHDSSHLDALTRIKIGVSNGKEPWIERVIHVGLEYRIEPHNPLKRRNRHGECTVLGFMTVSATHGDVVARVRFLDNNRPGRAELIPPPKINCAFQGGQGSRSW